MHVRNYADGQLIDMEWWNETVSLKVWYGKDFTFVDLDIF